MPGSPGGMWKGFGMGLWWRMAGCGAEEPSGGAGRPGQAAAFPGRRRPRPAGGSLVNVFKLYRRVWACEERGILPGWISAWK